MRGMISSLLFVAVIVLATPACRWTLMGVADEPAVVVATELPLTPEPPASAEVLSLAAAPELDQTGPQEPSLSTQAPAKPPGGACLGDTWTRPTDDMAMVYVPAGEFEMGSTDAQLDEAVALCNQAMVCPREEFEDEKPAHTVALDGFWIDRTEVMNAQYRGCVEAGRCKNPEFHNYRYRDAAWTNHPMVYVDWFAAGAYCEWTGARLPTEAEWEYAARGPEGRVFPWGDEFAGDWLNYCDANCTKPHADETADDGYEYTAPVGSYPNGVSWVGALDMVGNVTEWVADPYDEYPSQRQENPTGPASGEGRVLRGGNWTHVPATLRGASRKGFPPGRSWSDTGFRCARDGG